MFLRKGNKILTVKDTPEEGDAFEYLPTIFFKGQLIIKQFEIGKIATKEKEEWI